MRVIENMIKKLEAALKEQHKEIKKIKDQLKAIEKVINNKKGGQK